MRLSVKEKHLRQLRELEAQGYLVVENPSGDDFDFWGKLREPLGLTVAFDRRRKNLVVVGNIRVFVEGVWGGKARVLVEPVNPLRPFSFPFISSPKI